MAVNCSELPMVVLPRSEEGLQDPGDMRKPSRPSNPTGDEHIHPKVFSKGLELPHRFGTKVIGRSNHAKHVLYLTNHGIVPLDRQHGQFQSVKAHYNYINPIIMFY